LVDSPIVAHGFRSLASTTLNEHGFNPDLIETALAHMDKNTTRGSYNFAQYLTQRREMMQWWSNHIDDAASQIKPSISKKHLKIVKR